MKRIILVILMLATISFIWWHSAQDAITSLSESKVIAQVVAALLGKLGLVYALPDVDHAIRKLAHFTEFAGLGFFLILPLRAYIRNKVIAVETALLSGLIVADVDEYIQMFSKGRTSQISDVGIDFAGVIIGCIIGYEIFSYYMAKYQGRYRYQ